MKKLIIFACAVVLIGLCSFSANSNMRAPDCAACLTYEGYSDPGEPWAVTPCYSLLEGYCGNSQMCGPGTTEICYWYYCWVEEYEPYCYEDLP